MNSPKYLEQEIMERRYSSAYNWNIKMYSRKWRQKTGLWMLARELAGTLKRKAVLDAGCGDGWYAAKMLEEGAEVTGVDYSDRAVSLAKKNLPKAVFKTASLAKLPFADDFFDVIFCFQTLEHIPPAELSLVARELARVLKRDGKLVVSVPSVNRKLSEAHFQHFTPESLREMLESFFSEEQALGQEKKDMLMFILERLPENRFWFFPPLAKIINQNLFLTFWNRTDAKEGQNIVAKFYKV